MEGHSVILPQANAARQTIEFVDALRPVLEGFDHPFEFLVVDDHSDPSVRRELISELGPAADITLLQLRGGRGLDAAILAGIPHARHDTVVAVDPAGGYCAADLVRLVRRINRHDLVIGRRRLSLPRKAIWNSIRWFAHPWPNDSLHDPDCLFWAARRECLLGLQLPPGSARSLPSVVARSGFRIGELHVDWQPNHSRTVRRTPIHLFDVLAAWWLAGRPKAYHSTALVEDVTVRIDSAHRGPARGRSAAHHLHQSPRAASEPS